MNEAAFSTQVYDLLDRLDWHWCHFRPAQTSKGWRTALQGKAGFPDIVAVREGRVLFIELKGDGGSLTPEQREWQYALGKRADVEYHLWWPDSPGLERMVEILR